MLLNRTSIPLFILCLYSLFSHAQENKDTIAAKTNDWYGFKVGLDVGFGTSWARESGYYFKDTLGSSIKAGFLVYFTPPKSIFQIKTGIQYSFRGKGSYNYSYVQAPLGLQVFIGRKVRFLVGAGVLFSEMFSVKGGGNKRKDFSGFQMASFFSAGIQTRLNKALELSVGIEYCRDFYNKMYSSDFYRHNWLPPDILDYYGRDIRINIGINYLIKKRKKS
jgi:hypothetical protein